MSVQAGLLEDVSVVVEALGRSKVVLPDDVVRLRAPVLAAYVPDTAPVS